MLKYPKKSGTVTFTFDLWPLF